MNKRETLTRVPLFAKLDGRHLDKLADMSVPKSFPKDTLLIKEGTVGLGMFVITSGRVEVYKGEGENRITLTVLESGSIVGEMALIDDQFRSANVRALEPTDCLLVSRDAFNTLIRQEPEIAMAIMVVLGERIRSSHSKIQELQSKVNEAVAEVREESRDWATEGRAGRRTERYEEPTYRRTAYEDATYAGASRAGADPIAQIMEAQRVMLRAGAEWMSSWMGMMGAFVGGKARMTDSAKTSLRNGLTEATTTMPRSYFRSFTSAIDEGLKSFEDVRTSGAPPREEVRTHAVPPREGTL
jgi:CRP-like cAMP-binding protein